MSSSYVAERPEKDSLETGLAIGLASVDEDDEWSLQAADLAGGLPLCFLCPGLVGVYGTFISGILTSSFSCFSFTPAVGSGSLISGSESVNSCSKY